MPALEGLIGTQHLVEMIAPGGVLGSAVRE